MVAETFGFDIIIDKRCKSIHDKDCVRKSFGVTSALAYYDGLDTYTDSVDNHSFGGHGRGHVVGRHIYSP